MMLNNAILGNQALCLVNAPAFNMSVVSSLKNQSQKVDLISSVPKCKIDTHGDFKYILIEVQDSSTNQSVFVVRGAHNYDFHREIMTDFIFGELAHD